MQLLKCPFWGWRSALPLLALLLAGGAFALSTSSAGRADDPPPTTVSTPTLPAPVPAPDPSPRVRSRHVRSRRRRKARPERRHARQSKSRRLPRLLPAAPSVVSHPVKVQPKKAKIRAHKVHRKAAARHPQTAPAVKLTPQADARSAPQFPQPSRPEVHQLIRRQLPCAHPRFGDRDRLLLVRLDSGESAPMAPGRDIQIGATGRHDADRGGSPRDYPHALPHDPGLDAATAFLRPVPRARGCRLVGQRLLRPSGIRLARRYRFNLHGHDADGRHDDGRNDDGRHDNGRNDDRCHDDHAGRQPSVLRERAVRSDGRGKRAERLGGELHAADSVRRQRRPSAGHLQPGAWIDLPARRHASDLHGYRSGGAIRGKHRSR